MFKKTIIGSLAVCILVLSQTNAFAEKIKSDLTVYSQVLASPLHFNVKTNDSLELTIINKSNNDIDFNIPMLKSAVTVEKNSKIVVPVDFSKPPEKSISFFIQQEGSNRKEGNFVVTDYSVPKLTSNVQGIDTSALKDIINYSKTSEWYTKYTSTTEKKENTVVISEKDEPVKINTTETKTETTKPATPKKKRFIRGYW